jgi:pimeloyl-ACP methyl ester carboxylesterase
MKPVVPLLFPDVPRLLAQQGLMHTYEAYAEAFNDMLEADVRGWLAARTVPRLFVHGTRDRYCAPGDLERILGVTVHSIEGDHGLPFREPEACLRAIESFLETLPETTTRRPDLASAAD